MSINIKRNQLKRVVIVGGGLGGLRLAEDLSKANLQVVLIDKNNFHQFPPLIYQIASAGIDPSSISFPFRQIFRKRKNFYFRMAEARAVFPDKKRSGQSQIRLLIHHCIQLCILMLDIFKLENHLPYSCGKRIDCFLTSTHAFLFFGYKFKRII